MVAAVDELDGVVTWRERALIVAGYPADDAIELSMRLDVDLHLACRLLEQGCPVDIALAILR